ncbi:MAG: hypothetical protein FJ387_00595 [Verrucomicrobia bacterium]|nr:hypothetical protein [Verrucomicrobiota bacterium]
MIESDSDGVLQLNLSADQYVLLHAYPRVDGQDGSRINPNPNKLWLETAPATVWPNDAGHTVRVGHHTVAPLQLTLAFERLSWPPQTLRQTAPLTIHGRGTRDLWIEVPDADPADIHHRSTAEGGVYRWRARLWQAGRAVAEAELPVRLLWGVRPRVVPPATVHAGQAYAIELEWQDLPAYEPDQAGLPLSRTAHWERWAQARQHYDVALQMLDPRATSSLATTHSLGRVPAAARRISRRRRPTLARSNGWRTCGPHRAFPWM